MSFFIRSRRTNGQGELDQLRDHARQLTASAGELEQVTEQVSAGVTEQRGALDSALSTTNEMSASLHETAGQAAAALSEKKRMAAALAAPGRERQI